MKRIAALFLAMSITGCSTFIEDEILDVPNYDVDPYEPEITRLYDRERRGELQESFEENCSYVYSLMQDSAEEYWMWDMQELLGSEQIQAAFPGQEERLVELGAQVPQDGPPYIVNSVCDFDGQLMLGLLAGEMGEYVTLVSLTESGEYLQSEMIGGVMDANYSLGYFDGIDELVFKKGYGDAGYLDWSYFTVDLATLEMTLLEECSLSYYDADGMSTDEPTKTCSAEYKLY